MDPIVFSHFCVLTIPNAIPRPTIDEVHRDIMRFGSKFRKVFDTSNEDFTKVVLELDSYFSEMKKEDEYFKQHYVKNFKMRKVILETLELCVGKVGRFSKAINGKDLLIKKRKKLF